MESRGFTLLEVIVSLTVLATLTVASHAAVRTIVDLSDHAAERRLDAIQAATLRRQLVSWVTGVAVGPGAFERFDGIRGGDGLGSPGDVLSLLTYAGGSLPQDPPQPVRLTLRVDRGRAGGSAGLVAERLSLGESAANGQLGRLLSEAAVERIMLVPYAERVSFRYLFINGRTRIWVSSWSSTAHLPAAVELRVHGGSVPPLLRVPVTIPLPTGG